MTDIHRSDAEIERLWEELASRATEGHPPAGDDRNGLLRLYRLTHDALPARARHAVDRIVRPLMRRSDD